MDDPTARRDTVLAAHTKLERLRGDLKGMRGVVVAYSGGVDSTFLLKVAHDELGGGVLAVTNRARHVPAREVADSVAFCAQQSVRHLLIEVDPLMLDGFADNPQDRCYMCKRALFSQLEDIARERGASCVVDGTNVDDTTQYRPGMRALEELEIVSPLRDAGLTKAEIRLLSHEMGLATWDKPSCACLVTRFPYGQRITRESLSQVEQAETLLSSLGFGQLRVRMHADMARIEVEPAQMQCVLEGETRMRIVEGLRRLGFTYVTLDLQGYRSGSMDEPLR